MTREEVITRLCSAIKRGRDLNHDWSFPSDCFCSVSDTGSYRYTGSFQFDEKFLHALEIDLENSAQDYTP
jgi:hypothetical protein